MVVVLTLLSMLIAVPAFAQPKVTNGEARAIAINGALTRTAVDAHARTSGTAWLAYAVPIVDGERWICDGHMYRDGIRLERGSGGPSASGQTAARDRAVMMLEGARQVWVLYRLDGGRVDRIRVASEDCTLDAGGLTVEWLAKVSASESVALLATFLTDASSRRLANGALTALAMHREPSALDRLLTTARDGATTHLRGQALFWLAQRAGDKAVGAISDAIANDPETDVKRRAVFALSQLPKEEGVPRLIEVARTNTNPAVRKQAMFWLGQSRDPRAVTFFEELLFK